MLVYTIGHLSHSPARSVATTLHDGTENRKQTITR